MMLTEIRPIALTRLTKVLSAEEHSQHHHRTPPSCVFSYIRGRVALAEALRALDTEGGAVAIQAYTCMAVPQAVTAAGARPLWIDIDPERLSMAPGSLVDRLTPDTRAVVVQHTFGIPARIEEIVAICSERDIPVIEDCCHGIPLSYAIPPIGTYGSCAFYSFEWGKPCILGLGGLLVAHDEHISSRLAFRTQVLEEPPLGRQLRLELSRWLHAVLYSPRRYWRLKSALDLLRAVRLAERNVDVNVEEFVSDFSYKMGKVQRHVLRHILAKAADDAEKYRRTQRRWLEALNETGVHPIGLDALETNVYARIPIAVYDKKGVIEEFRKAKLEIASWYDTPVHPLNAQGERTYFYNPDLCPNARAACRTVVSLPMNKVTKRFCRAAAEILGPRVRRLP